MAGIGVGATPHGGRRSLDSEINMIPMIDLLIVTISFLLITAVWSQLARIDASAIAPGARETPAPASEVSRLHVELKDPAKITLHWDLGPTVVRTSEIPRAEVNHLERGVRTVSFPALEAKLAEEWTAQGRHRDPNDATSDELVLHTGDSASYAEIVAAMDAAYGVKRGCFGGRSCPAFRVILASN